jgi:hypothetical protein
MLRLIGLTLVLALTLAAMPAPASAQPPSPQVPPILSSGRPGSQANSAVAVPNFISYRDRARTTSSESDDPDDPVQLADDHDPSSSNAIPI